MKPRQARQRKRTAEIEIEVDVQAPVQPLRNDAGNIYFLPYLPADVWELVFAGNLILSVADVKHFAQTCRNNLTMFSGLRSYGFWTKMLMRDFGAAAPPFENPHDVYKELVCERQRIIAYTQILLTIEERSELTPSINILKRRQDHPEFNPEIYLSRQLLLRQYTGFMESVKGILAGVDQTKLNERHATLEKAYASICIAKPDQVNATMEPVLVLMDNIINNDQLHVPETEDGMIVTMLSVLGKCGATRTLNLLLGKLSDVNKFTFFESCAINICRDAAMFAHYKMVRTLLKNVKETETLGVSPDAVGAHCVLFDEDELSLFPCVLKALQSFCLMREVVYLEPKHRENLLNEFSSIILAFRFFGVNPYLLRDGRGLGFLGVVVREAGNSIDFANEILKQLPGMLLSDSDKQIIYAGLQEILAAEVKSDEEQLYEAFESPSKKQQRDEFSDAEDGSDEELKTPPKKSKPQSESDEEVVFGYSPDNDAEDEEVAKIISPARRLWL